MKKLALLLLSCLMLAALPALAEVGLISENPLQFDLPVVAVNDVITMPDGNLLLSATCNDAALPGQWAEYVICTDRTGAVQWSHCLFSHPEKQTPFEMKIALKPEGIVCMKHDQPYQDDLCNEIKWLIGYDGTMREANTSSVLTADKVPDVFNCGDFCIEMDMEYFDRKDGYPTRIFNCVTGASAAFVHPMGRCSFLPLGDKLLMFDITYNSPMNAWVFSAECESIAEFVLHVEGEKIAIYDAIESDTTLYLFVNTANGGQPARYVVIPVDKATAAVGDTVGVHAYPDKDNTGNGRALIDGGMLELMGWQPIWEAPMHYGLRYVTVDGNITVLDEIALKPYDIQGLDQAFFRAIPNEQCAVLLFRDAATGQCILRSYGALME